ncbi:DNA repair protein RecO [Natronospora cellulosivora (SeqCode)]
MAVINTEGIVIKQFDLGEADKIITFYTKDYGIIRAVAKGVRKGKNRLSGIVLPFSYNNITVYQGRSSLGRINHLNNIYTFTKLREDLTKMAYASFMAEIVDKVGLESDPNQILFSLLLASFHKILIKESEEIKYVELAFKILILSILGYKPEIKQCVSCKNEILKISTKKYIFDIKYGGLLCNNCTRSEYTYNENRDSISEGSLQIIETILEYGIKSLDKIIISKRQYEELDRIINKFLFYHLDLKLKSLDFLNMIKDLG